MQAAVEYFKLMAAKQRRGRGEILTHAEQELLAQNPDSLPKLCSCGCGKPLEPRVDTERHQIGGKEVNEDCYFNSLGDGLEKFPIGGHGVKRR